MKTGVDPREVGRRSLQVSLPEDDYTRLQERAEANGASLAGYVRGCLREMGLLAPGPQAKHVHVLNDVLAEVPTPDEKTKALEVNWTDEATQLLKQLSKALKHSKTAGVTFNLKSNRKPWSKEAVNQVILALGSKGWDVKRQTGSEPRDPQGWDDLVVEKP